MRRKRGRPAGVHGEDRGLRARPGWADTGGADAGRGGHGRTDNAGHRAGVRNLSQRRFSAFRGSMRPVDSPSPEPSGRQIPTDRQSRRSRRAPTQLGVLRMTVSPRSCASGSASPPSGRTRRRCAAPSWTASDVLLVMPTGAGKSLCYQLPGLARGGTTLVVSPAHRAHGGPGREAPGAGPAGRAHPLRPRPRRVARGRARPTSTGRLDFLFIAPERLRVPGFPEMLARRTPALVAVDEAHCISRVGARLPARLPPPRRAAARPAAGADRGAHRHRHPARPGRHRGAARPRRPRAASSTASAARTSRSRPRR